MKISVSNNNHILKKGDLIKVVKQVKFVMGSTIKINSLYFIKDVWNTTSGDIVLKKQNEKFDFVMQPSHVNKVLNYDKQLEVV